MKKGIMAVGAALLALVTLAGCTEAAASGRTAAGTASPETSQAGESGEGAQQVYKNTAMYVPFGKDSYIMVDQDSGMVYTVTMPEDLYNEQGNKIAPEELQKGNIVEIYGNGAMLESYPGQYPGVEKIQVVAQGKPSDADQYQSLVDELYQEADPAEPPSLNVTYRTPQAAVTAMIGRGGYEWSYPQENSETQSVVACGEHVLQWNEINDLTLSEATDLALVFFPEIPQTVTAVRWPVSRRGASEEIPEGEAVPVRSTDDGFTLEGAQAGYVYLITGVWEQGNAEFGFLTK